MAKLSCSYMGLDLKSPFVVASSGLTQSIDKIKEFETNGASAVIIKSLFEEQIRNEAYHISQKEAHNTSYPEAIEYIQEYTRKNSLEKHLNIISEAKKAVNIPVIASLSCISNKEWEDIAKKVESAGADAIEINAFIIPTSRTETSEEIEQKYIDILKTVKAATNLPIGMKIGSHYTNIVRMVDQLKAYGAASVTLFNRFYEPDIDIETLQITSSEIFSSSSDLRRSLRWVGIVSGHVEGIDIAASTGIHNGEDVIKQLLAGATVTQLCSSLYINGAEHIQTIEQSLLKWMDKWNFNNLNEFRGRLSNNPSMDQQMFERAQFMKYFSEH
ncbi:dihydroorotate dehydrogenase-like protein [Halosquirtibacter xylanolyticus]|uniref:dihydroorotate dehydrogenase-like protein n=1 Tax=Halosquirtibacter xylanolyticus TaxID=3374599 RepID=UPI003749620C|nr:dihydroorotate dehydrogenase-like protein [Prolixibacteraceae bacterium]